MGPQWGPALQGASTHRAGARWGWREQPGSFPCAARAPCSLGLVCIRMSVASLCSFYMCCCCSLTPPHILALCTPRFPSSRHPSSSQELEKPLSGARPLPHPPSQGVCLALPSVLPPVQAEGLAGRGALKERGRRACPQPTSGPCSSLPSPSHTQSRSSPWPFEPPERGLFSPCPFPPRGLHFRDPLVQKPPYS